MERVTQHIYARTDIKGCNPGYVITSEGVVVIDTPQLPTKALEMREEVRSRGPIRFLINTEHHLDHIFGNYFFAGQCPVVGHEDMMKDFWTVSSGKDPYDYMLDLLKTYDPQGISLLPSKDDFVVNPPNILFRDRLTLHLGKHVFELIHTPGHTRGQSAVYIPTERAVFVGDTIFSKCQAWLHSCDPESWLRSLELLKHLDVDIIIPGHGPVCNKSYIAEQSAFLHEWVTAVAAGIRKGWSKEECADRISFLDRYPMDIGLETYGPTVQKWNVERIYDFLEGKTEKFQ